MKIEKIKIKNFRSYKKETEIPLKDMNILLGKNDIGKSTILEALDIFFNDGKGCVSISEDDINKDSDENTIEISICFSEFNDEILLDTTVSTNISEEYLLNTNGLLEIKKIYSGATLKPTTFIVARHPINDEFIQDILLKKLPELKKFITENNIETQGADLRIASDCRRIIRDSYNSFDFDEIEIPVDKEGAKEIRNRLIKQLPTYTLFQADRSNSDQDNEVQNPMNVALKNILNQEDILEKLEEVFNKVKAEMESVAEGTLEQLQKINPTLAQELLPKLPEFQKLGWQKAFPKTEITSDEIPLNKRGSGVKRMVLLSFFMNEVERRKREENLSDIIYAFEEPETSQHPDHQEILMKAFYELSRNDGVQIILTTHSPYVYKELIKKTDVNLLYIKNENGLKNISDIFSTFSLFPHSPSWGEINYLVYELPTFEFFDELYSRLEELNNTGNHVDDFICANSSISKSEKWKRAKRNGTLDMEIDSTYITCIRHQIHHSDNTLNPDYKTRLKEGIDDMIRILKSLS